MTDRDPICDHRSETIGRVSSHEDLAAANQAGKPTASTNVCGRNECVIDAAEWVAEVTGEPGRFYSFPVGRNRR